MKIAHLQSLLFELKKLPGIGPRSAERMVQHFLKSKDQDLKQLSELLAELKSKVKPCSQCFSFTEEELCFICQDPLRSSGLICVVEQAFDVFRMEKGTSFKGLYHVLNGVLSPLNNVHPENLNLQQLKDRVLKENVKELILALDSDLEGDTTALYIKETFKNVELKISRPALGIPLGSDLSFVDDRTLTQAIENRNYL